MQIFKQIGPLHIDPNKKTVVFYDKGDQEKYTHIYGAARVVKEFIKDQFNIITIGMGCGLKENYFEFKRSYDKSLHRKNNNPNWINDNAKKIEIAFERDFKNLPKIDYVILGTDDPFRIPLTTYCSKSYDEHLYNLKNEFFDYIGGDKKIIERIEKINEKIVNNWQQKISVIAFSTKDNSIIPLSIDFINRKKGIGKVIAFAIDPAIYEPFYRIKNIPLKMYYFVDDKRGTRKFNKLDIAQLQHLVYDKIHGKDYFDYKKTKNLFFAGSIFQEKGTRANVWNEFLKDFNDKDSSYYIPLRKNGGVLKKKENTNQISTVKERFPDLYSEVINHPCYKPASGPGDKTTIIKEYRYGMIFRCVSFYDSLNFRPVLYSAMNILPLLDYAYDPEHLQIPEKIQAKIIVRSAAEIQYRINYYNKNEDERMNVINELRDLFNVNDYVSDKQDKKIKEQIKIIIPEFE